MPKCKLTISGKHIFKDFFDGYSEVKREGTTIIGIPKFMSKCIACGMIDDTLPKAKKIGD